MLAKIWHEVLGSIGISDISIEQIEQGFYALKRLLNHKMSNDVTAGYIVVDVERLRTNATDH